MSLHARGQWRVLLLGIGLLCRAGSISAQQDALDATVDATDAQADAADAQADAADTGATRTLATPAAPAIVARDASLDAAADAFDDADALSDADSASDGEATLLDAGADAEPDASDAALPVYPERAEEPPPPPTVAETRPAPLPQVERRGVAVRTILGLLALLVLAYVGNHPRVRQLQETLRLGSAISVGFPFVALGLIARHPAVGVLDDRVLLALTPLVDFGLGWLGFLVGFRFDLALLDRLPRGSALVVALCTGMPFIAIILACGVTLMTFGFGMQDATTIRAVVVLGAAGAMTAPSAIRRAFPGAAEHTVGQHLDEIFGVIVLALLAAYMRPSGLQAQWALPGTAWVFMTLGIGATLSTVLYVSVRRPATPAEFMAIAVGSIAFAAGLAAYLRLSPLVICFVAGVAISNLPSAHREAFGRTLERFEQPIFLVFLALAGALWDPSDWRGWVLVPVFVASRAVGLRLGQFLAVKREPDAIERIRPRSLYLAPLSGVAIAVVINVRSLYGGPAVSFLITAVIGGAILAELVAAYSSRASNTGGAS